VKLITKLAGASVLAAMLAVCGTAAQASDGLPPGVAVQSSDYRTDRAAFRTKLIAEGPSPQGFKKQTPPPGVEEISFPSGALTLKAWLGMPDQRTERMPVVIFLHGGFAFGASDFEMGEPYRKAGFVLVTPMLRGENGQAGHFSMFYDEVDDVLALAEHIRKQPYADPSRIFLAGHSAGGTVTLLSAMASPVFARVASFSASPDQVFFTSGPPWSEIAQFDLTNARELEMRSPLAYATSLKSPTRLYVGSQELSYRVTTPKLAALAKAAKLDVESSEMKGDHFSYVPAAIEDSIAFFNLAK
jgi:dipeptidyl aminopeptidase/acylaminoacyl peptidase